jgi:UDP:flavonoid glycosyltransferase YjiC (YdhE family)
VDLPEFKNCENFHFVKAIPYDWIFKKAYAVIHHGGSGTTHTALKYGCVSLIIPHIMDQFGWNCLVQKLGVGPKGISINTLTPAHAKRLIYSLYHEEGYKKKAAALSALMLSENMEQDLYKFIVEN